jgi:hypothetical protein
MFLAPLDLHHKHYRTLGEEGLDDVELLCRACHDKQHFNYGAFDDEMWSDINDPAAGDDDRPVDWPDDDERER